MPRTAYRPALIEVDVSDRLPGKIKQKVRFESLSHTQTPEGTGRVVITVRATLFESLAGAYGPPLAGQGFSTYTRELVADNYTVVDAATGAELAVRGTETDTQWQAVLDGLTPSWEYQGDFFCQLRDNAPVSIGALIRQHIQRADTLGRFGQ